MKILKALFAWLASLFGVKPKDGPVPPPPPKKVRPMDGPPPPPPPKV
jgi:hypothetical protein